MTGVQAKWIKGSTGLAGKRTNRASYDEAVGNNLTKEAAAFETFTGKVLGRLGFTRAKVTVDPLDVEERSIMVLFEL